MRKVIRELPSEHKQDVEELGCVLADMTDSCSSKEEEHSQSQDSPVHSPSAEDTNFGFSEEQLGTMADCELVSDTMSNTDLENWNNVLQDFLMTDKQHNSNTPALPFLGLIVVAACAVEATSYE